MEKCVVSFDLPSDLFLAVHDLAAEKQGTVSSVIEELLAAHLATRQANTAIKPKGDGRIVLAMQRLLFRDFADASSWDDLDKRLARHGYYMSVVLGGLSLHTETSGRRICNLHDLGFSYGQFIRRFGPGQPRDPSKDRRAG